MITIDKNIPLAPNLRRSKYPWAEMDVGDSFFLAAEAAGMRSLEATLLRGAVSASVRLGRKFARRRVDGGVRVWRTE